MFNSHNRMMAYTPLPKLVPIGSPRIVHEDITKNMIAEVLQSEPVKRLLNQPNIVIKAISLTPSNQVSIHHQSHNNNGSDNIGGNKDKRDDSVTLSNSHLDDEANFLPSKNDGKSEIALLPIKRVRKKCGHYESCENIICDVNFQQYVDYEGSSPILAFNIDESEINAPVYKHCESLHCDALSIDHNRCRRAVIRLSRYDKLNVCDICGILLKTRKSRINHKNCKRKNIYRHNDIDNAQIMRERMRIKELQLMAALRMKKNNYSDPKTADDKAIEILKNNSELIVIPKTIEKMPTVQSTPVSASNTISNQSNQNINDLMGSVILANKPVSVSISESSNNTVSSRNSQPPAKQMQKHHEEESNKNSSSNVVKVELVSDGKVKSLDNQFIVTGVPQGSITYPLSMNDWVMAHSAGTPILPAQKPYLMPVRVVPIANLKSEPSLLHQTQGIPKFCIIADNSASPQSFINVQTIPTIPIRSLQTLSTPAVPVPVSISASIVSAPTSAATTQASETPTKESSKSNKKSKDDKKIIKQSPSNNLQSTKSRGHYNNRNKKRGEKKLFICTYCSKRFLTEWYFKMHIARHIGEVKATCEICEKTFTHHYDLKRHINAEHKGKVKSSMKNENKIEIFEDMNAKEKERDFPIRCDHCESVFNNNFEIDTHNCNKIIDALSKNNSVIITHSLRRECSDEIEKENGIVKKNINEALSKIKVRKIVRNQRKVFKKRIRRRKNKNRKYFNVNKGEQLGGGGKLKS